MSFASLNGVNAARGIGGTVRANTATFNQAAAAPLAGQAQGMGPQSAAASSPLGSSYTQGAGMQNTGRMGTSMDQVGSVGELDQLANVDPHGVNPGRQGKMANVGAMPAPMSTADMQDPENAALAGYAYSATQDKQPSASTNPQQMQAPQARPQQSAASPGVLQGGAGGDSHPAAMAANPAAAQTAVANNPISAALGPGPKVTQGMPILNRQVM